MYIFRRAIFTTQQIDVEHTETVEQEDNIFEFRHPLTGYNTSEDVDKPVVFALMVDNHIWAQPQSGIDQAFYIIEAPVEANIPRYLA